MTIWDTAGYLVSSLVITAFCMKDIIAHRGIGEQRRVSFLRTCTRPGTGLAAARDLVAGQSLAIVAIPCARPHGGGRTADEMPPSRSQSAQVAASAAELRSLPSA